MTKRIKKQKHKLKNLIKEGDGGGGPFAGTVFTSTNSGVFNPTFGGNGKRKRPHIRKPTKKKSGIERLDAFLRDFTPVPKSIAKQYMSEASKELLSLINYVRAEYPTRGYGGNLGRKQLDWKKPNSNEEPPKVSEFKGEINHEEDEQDESAVIEQNDVERKIRNLDNKSRKEGRDQSTEDEISAPDLVTMKGLSPSADDSNPYKRGGKKDQIDNNPEIVPNFPAETAIKDELQKFFDNLSKEVGGAATQTIFQERDVIDEEEEDGKKEDMIEEENHVKEVKHPKGQRGTYSTDE